MEASKAVFGVAMVMAGGRKVGVASKVEVARNHPLALEVAAVAAWVMVTVVVMAVAATVAELPAVMEAAVAVAARRVALKGRR